MLPELTAENYAEVLDAAIAQLDPDTLKASATAQELQMNENKASNAEEICKLFGIPASMICGSKTGFP